MHERFSLLDDSNPYFTAKSDPKIRILFFAQLLHEQFTAAKNKHITNDVKFYGYK